MDKEYIAIAIDGPAGAGKTTQAALLAKRLGYVYVDTGAMYRAFAVHKLWMERELGRKVSIETALNTFDFEFVRDEAGNQQIMVCGQDVTEYLRAPEVSMEASSTSANSAVRAALLECQRKQSQAGNVIMEGRDIGTVVLPDAQVKIYLDADLSVRAARRLKELQGQGCDGNYKKLMEEMAERDRQDMSRENAPLKRADDAVLVDCTTMDIEETAQAIMAIINDKTAGLEYDGGSDPVGRDKEEDVFHRTYQNVIRYEAVCKELARLYIRKNMDCCDSFHLSYQEEGVAMARIHLVDTLNRFKTLSGG